MNIYYICLKCNLKIKDNESSWRSVKCYRCKSADYVVSIEHPFAKMGESK